MKKIVVDHTADLSASASSDRWDWRVDAQGRVSHGRGFGYIHNAKTCYTRDMGRWTKLGYWCDRCQVGLLLELGKLSLESRSTEDVAQRRLK